jgi:hypothetical protein
MDYTLCCGFLSAGVVIQSCPITHTVFQLLLVSPVHLNQLQARCQATHCVVAFHWQELLFNPILSLTQFFNCFWSLQSILINFKLDIRLHFMSWLSVSRSCCLISPYRSPGPQILHQFFFLHIFMISPIHLCHGFPLAGVFVQYCSITHEVVQFSIAFHTFSRSPVHLNQL